MPTSVSLSSLRQMLSADLSDIITGTASGGSGTTLTATGEITRYAAGSLLGVEVSTISGTGLGQSRSVTTHANSGGTVTLTVPAWTAVGSDTVYELHRIGGRGFTKTQYDNAIYQAIDALVDYMWTDTDTVQLAVERGNGESGTATLGLLRREYPLPSGFNGIYAVDYLQHPPVQTWGTGNFKAWRALGDAAARTRLSQGIQVTQAAFIGYIAVFMAKAGTPTDNLTCVVETDSSALPSGTAVTNGTSGTIAGSTVQTRGRYVVFTFDPPIFLSANTQYHATLRRSGATDASNYFLVGEDTAGNYGYGSLSLYGGAAWTAVAASDLIFAASLPGGAWAELAARKWDYRGESTDQLYLRGIEALYEGTPIRIRGGAAVARPSAETSTIAIRPEWVITVAKAILEAGKTGRQDVDNHAQAAGGWFRQLGIQPPPRRPLPANWRVVYT